MLILEAYQLKRIISGLLNDDSRLEFIFYSENDFEKKVKNGLIEMTDDDASSKLTS